MKLHASAAIRLVMTSVHFRKACRLRWTLLKHYTVAAGSWWRCGVGSVISNERMLSADRTIRQRSDGVVCIDFVMGALR
jgi:hypothetical protein